MSDGWVDKVWGKTREITSDKVYSLHELDVIAGSYCSMHYHKFRSNKFIVNSGVINVVEFYGPHIKTTTLKSGDSLSVPALVVHLFAVIESGSIYEEYFSEHGDVDPNDIIRIVSGGLCDDFDLLPNKLLLSAINGLNV